MSEKKNKTYTINLGITGRFTCVVSTPDGEEDAFKKARKLFMNMMPDTLTDIEIDETDIEEWE